MTSLQKVVLGTPPAAVDGDTVRVANTKTNANVDVLNAQATLTSAAGITAPSALTAAHIGKRVNIALAAAGAVNMPPANSGSADSVVLVRNIGTTAVSLPAAVGAGDTVALSKLNPGEAALMDTDGVHAWTVVTRGRTNSDNEVVNGTLTTWGTAFLSGGLSVTGAAAFAARPTFNGNTPLDSGNAAITGAVMYFAMSAAPAGFLKANGALVSRTTYAALFAAIGTSYGAGDGSTSFGLPDLRGTFVRSWDDSKGVDSGRALGSAQAQNLPPHSHLIPIGWDGNNFWGNGGTPAYGDLIAQNGGPASGGSVIQNMAGLWNNQGTTNIRQAYSRTDANSITGELRPANVALLACIKF
ncbi:phage tail protein [Paraburkholderia sp. BCC1884]|uniref:phage tail protein n=1 Tax=Paraburkholderia sp. BCC1884 TaxID=2562668 RepID=UPI001182A395|nr:phage tail protein [Paraburkholderia sp. BCC1884]